ncbi:MAG: amino acid permease [Methanomicrobiales archaeon]|nr:amino acid permease [Methanomicrobiales archaeon]
MTELTRSLGLWTATGIGIGAIIGTGIFVLIGVAAGLAGPSVILSFLVAGSVALLSGLSAAELSSFITEAGASYIYTTKAFGAFAGFIVGWMKSFDYIIGASAVSLGFAAYLAYFVGISPANTTLVAIGTIWPLFLMLLNLKGMKEASGANNVLVILKVSALVLLIAIGGYHILFHGDYSYYSPFFPNGIRGMLTGASIIFFAFIGFNTVAMVAEEVKDPERNVHRAIILSFAICTLLYIGVAIVAVGLVDWQTLGTSKAPLELALGIATDNPFLLKFVAVSALFATTSVILSSMIGASRALFAMARKGVIPPVLAKVSSRGIPSAAVILSGVVISLIVLLTNADLEWLASIFNFGTPLTFFFINASLLQLRRTMPDANRRFSVPLYPYTPVLGLASCIALALFLNINAIIAGAGWISVGVLAYVINSRQEEK